MRKAIRLCRAAGLIVIVLGLGVIPAFADDPPWPLPVGEQIIVREYPSWQDGGPNVVEGIRVTDSSIWWKIKYLDDSDHALGRYNFVTRVEEEYPQHVKIRQIVVTPDDADVLFWAWSVPGEVDCLYRFHVPTQEFSCIYQVEALYRPAWDFDLDDPWVVWNRQNESASDRSYLMNWREGGEPVLLDPGWADDPHISYPWAVWKATGPGGDFAKARNLETEEIVTTDACFRAPDVDNGLLVYAVGEYLLSHLFVLDLSDPLSGPRQISWDNGVERPVIHNGLVAWYYFDGATGRSAKQGLDLGTGLTFDIAVSGESIPGVWNNVVAWREGRGYPQKTYVYMMLTRPYPLRGDLNGDNVVDITDIMLVASHWRDAEGDPGYDKGWDLNWDRRVDVVDIMLVAKHWGETWSPAE